MKKHMRIVTILLTIALLLTLAACGSGAQKTDGGSNPAPAETGASTPSGSSEKTYTIRFSSMNPALDNKYAVVAKAYFNFVTEATGGAIVFEEYYNSTANDAADALSACRSGIVDLAELYGPFWGNNFPLWELFFQPFQFSFPDGIVWTHVICAMMEKYPEFVKEVEDQGVKFWTVHGDGVNQLFSKEPIRTVADLKGKIINVGSTVDKKLMETLGATTEMLNAMDVYDNVSKGVIDGFDFCYIGGLVTGAADAVDYVTEVNGAHQTWFIFMNVDTYNSLPAEYRYLFDYETMKEWIYLWGYQFAQDDTWARNAIDESKTIIYLSDEDYTLWQEAAEPLYQEWIDKVTALGYNGAEMWDYFQAKIQEYSTLGFEGYRETLEKYGVEIPDTWTLK